MISFLILDAPFCVGASEDFGVALTVEDDEVVTDGINEGTVVGDEDGGSFVGAGGGFAGLWIVDGAGEGGFDAFCGGDVEVVGGFVEDEEILCTCQEPGEDGSGFFAAGHGLEWALLIFAGEEERAGDGAGLEFGEDDCFVGVLFDGVLDVAEDGFGHVDVVMGLGEVPDVEVGTEFDGSLVEFLFAEDAADECGFS